MVSTRKVEGGLGFAQLFLRILVNTGNESGKTFWVVLPHASARYGRDEVIDVIAAYPCFVKQIHLPLQSGDIKSSFA